MSDNDAIIVRSVMTIGANQGEIAALLEQAYSAGPEELGRLEGRFRVACGEVEAAMVKLRKAREEEERLMAEEDREP